VKRLACVGYIVLMLHNFKSQKVLVAFSLPRMKSKKLDYTTCFFSYFLLLPRNMSEIVKLWIFFFFFFNTSVFGFIFFFYYYLKNHMRGFIYSDVWIPLY